MLSHKLRNWNSFFFYTVLKNFPCIHIFQRYSFKKSLRSAKISISIPDRKIVIIFIIP